MTLAILTNQLPPFGTGEALKLNDMKDNSSSVRNPSAKEWCGRAVTVIKKGMDAAAKSAIALTHKTFHSIAELGLTTNEVAGVFRKLQKHSLSMVEYFNDTPGYFKKLIGITTHYVGIVDVVQIFGDVNYFANKEWKEKIEETNVIEYKPADRPAMIAARTSLTAVDIGCVMLWFEELGFYKLANAAEAIGNVRIFGCVPDVVASIPGVRDVAKLQTAAKALGELRVFSFLTKVSCVFVVLRALDLMYACFAINSAQNLIDAYKDQDQGKTERSTKMIKEGLYLSSYLAELTISAVLLAGVTNVVALGTLGFVCIGTAMSAFIYKTLHEEALKPKLPDTVKLNPPRLNLDMYNL